MRYRTTALLALPLLVAGVALPGHAATPVAERSLVLELTSAGTGTSSVTVPAARTLGSAERVATAKSLLPGTTVLAAATSAATSAGLRVVSGNTSEITVTGSAGIIDALVGADPAAPVTPSAWRGSVAGIIDASAGIGMWHSHAAQSFSALSQAYGGGVPSAVTPTLSVATPIIASIQLSGWDPSVLRSSARSVYTDPNYDPVGSGQFVAVNAGRSPAYDAKQDGDGDDEVSLDQETLLAAAPELKQRAYFAGNSATGYSLGLQAVFNDVAAGMPIVALSSSWGACETMDSVDGRNAIDAMLAKLTAVGVTVFAASGDSGTQDCLDTKKNPATGVDFPASDPHVIAVGATTHPNGSDAPAPDTAWSQAATANNSAGGSGGGSSSIFARPSYQNNATTSAGRAVPDLAVDGDPATGVNTIIEDQDSGDQMTVLAGGTSLSSPLLAAMIANVAAAHSAATGVPAGFGDIHAILYAHPEAFIDVVATTTAYGEGAGPTAFPTPGYDLASGLGTPRIDVLAGLLTAAPAAPVTVAAPVLNTAPALAITSLARPKSASASATVKWSVSGGSVASTGFVVLVAAGGKSSAHIYGSGTRSASFKLPSGVASVEVIMSSSAGSATSMRTLGIPTDDRRLAHGWTSVKDKKAFLGTLSMTAVPGRKAVLKASGTIYRITVRTGAVGGLATVLLDGHKVGTLDTYSSKTKEDVTKLFRAKRKGKHTLTLVVQGRRDARSGGSTVALDAMSAS